MPVMQGEAKVHVDASPEKVYELVSDVTRMGEWSPECTRAEWIDGATGPVAGARFKGTNKSGIARWSTKPEVLVAEPGREFAFRTPQTVWRYRVQPAGDDTDLIESFEVEKYSALYKLVIPTKKRQAQMQQGIETTLGRIKAAAEGSA